MSFIDLPKGACHASGSGGGGTGEKFFFTIFLFHQ